MPITTACVTKEGETEYRHIDSFETVLTVHKDNSVTNFSRFSDGTNIVSRSNYNNRKTALAYVAGYCRLGIAA